MIHTEFWLPF